MAIELVAVDDAATRGTARDLIAEYCRWIASCVAASYGLSFHIDAMVMSDIEDRAAFYPPSGRPRARRNGLETHFGEMSPRFRPGPNGRLA